MNLQPILENELVKIIPLTHQDLEPLYGVAKDPKIWEQHPCKRYRRTEFEKFFTESMKSGGAFILSDKITGKIIGSSRFQIVEGFPNGVEIGWTFLEREYWGGKYNKAVKDLMIKHAFNFVDNIVLYVAKGNIRSKKAVEKIHGQKISESDYPELPRKSPDNETYVINKPDGTHDGGETGH